MPNKSIEEILNYCDRKHIKYDGLPMTLAMLDILRNILTNERKQRDEAVKAELERIWSEVSVKTPTLLANYPRGKKDNYNTGRIDGWNICKDFIKLVITPTEDNQK